VVCEVGSGLNGKRPKTGVAPATKELRKESA
jgi:hypothetical protein